VEAAHSFIIILQEKPALHKRFHYVLIAFEAQKCTKTHILTGKLFYVSHVVRSVAEDRVRYYFSEMTKMQQIK